MNDSFMLSWVVVGLLLAFIAGGIASSRGLSFAAYFLVGLVLPVVGIILALLMPPQRKAVDDMALYGLVKQRAAAEAAREHVAWRVLIEPGKIRAVEGGNGSDDLRKIER